MPSIKSLLSSILLAPLVAAQIGGVCNDPIQSQSNPLSNRKNFITGTINGTVAVLPIDFATARSLIPSQYGILQNQYKKWLPSLPAGQYPALLQMDLFHDIYNKGKAQGTAGDFLRAAITFPFVDKLNDGYSSFAYQSTAIISTGNTAAQASYGQNGITVAPGFFSACNGYEYDNATLSSPPAQRRIDQAAWTNVNTDFSNPDLAYRLTPVASSPYSNNFFRNVTSQPLFGNGQGCDQLVRRLDTRVSKAPYAPVPINGDAAAMKSMYPPKTKTVFSNIYGLKADWAYWETKNVACPSLKGFSVVNAP